MRLFCHPLHPLTETGHALVCAAAAVFAALLLVAWSPAHSDSGDAGKADLANASLSCAREAR